MPRKPTAKQLATAHKKFREAATAYILEKGAIPDRYFYDFCIETPAGRLLIDVWDSDIMTRFVDAKRGRAFTESVGCPCNPYSGKWNFHFADDPASLDPEVALRHFSVLFEQLLVWKPPSNG